MRAYCVLAVVGLLTASSAFAQPGRGPMLGGYGGMMVPGYYQLGQESVQKQIDLVPEQKQKLEAISKKFMEDSQAAWKGQDWTKLRELPDAERQAKMKEMQDSVAKTMEAAKKEVEAVLLPHQIEKLKKLDFRQRASGMLYTPSVLEKLALTEEQKAKLKQVREEQQKKMAQLTEETMDKTMEVLTPEQQKQLEELGSKGWQGGGFMPGGGR